MEAEWILLGCVMDSPVAYYQAVEAGVSGESFSCAETGLIWSVMGGVVKEAGGCDRYSILTALKQRKHKSAMELVDKIPKDIQGDTAIVQINAIRHAEKTRKLKNLIVRYSQTEDMIEDQITRLASDAMGILHGSASHKVKSFSELAPTVLSEMEAIAKGEGDNLIGYDSWLTGINRWAIPYPKGMVTVKIGLRGLGKSTESRMEAVHQGRNGVKVGMISMEDQARDVVGNTVTVDGAGFLWKYQRGTGDMDSFRHHLDRVRDLPIYVIDAPQTISEIETSMTLLVAKYGVEFIIIDHLHHIVGDRGRRYVSIDDKYTDFMERIVSRNKSLGTACALYAQYSRDPEKHQRKPMISDVKGSSSIEQMARRIYQIYRDPDTRNVVIEGSKISNSAWGVASDRVVQLRYAPDHDGFEEII